MTDETDSSHPTSTCSDRCFDVDNEIQKLFSIVTIKNRLNTRAPARKGLVLKTEIPPPARFERKNRNSRTGHGQEQIASNSSLTDQLSAAYLPTRSAPFANQDLKTSTSSDYDTIFEFLLDIDYPETLPSAQPIDDPKLCTLHVYR